MKTKIIAFLLPLLLLFTGCKTPEQTRVLTRVAVQNGTYFGLQEFPEARAYVAAATPIICSAASDNMSPEEVNVHLEAIPKVDAGVMLINSALSLWLVWQPDSPHRKAALLGACEGLNLAQGGVLSSSGVSPKKSDFISRK